MGSFQQLYFDLVYNRVYDSTTARLARYRVLQERCLHALALPGARSLLCVGLGTGHELVRAMRVSPQTRVTGVDLSASALEASRRKVRRSGGSAVLQRMDAAALAFPDASFERVLCMHVLDFVRTPAQAVREMVRVLCPGGRFVFTLPSRIEGASLGAGLAREEVRTSLRSGRHPLAVTADLVARFVMGLVYVPLLARGGPRAFSVPAVRALFAGLSVRSLEIEEERTYQDYVVTGERA